MGLANQRPRVASTATFTTPSSTPSQVRAQPLLGGSHLCPHERRWYFHAYRSVATSPRSPSWRVPPVAYYYASTAAPEGGYAGAEAW